MKLQQRDGSLCDAETPILLEHLFTMTAGMSYDVKQPPLIDACQNPDAGTVDVVRAMAQIPLLFEPGTRYRYSLCHDVLAAVVEVASGMRFSEFVRKNIFDPCEMSEIGYHPTDEQLKRFCAMHTFVGRDGTCKPCGNENIYRFTKEYESGGAGVFTRTDEYIKMLSALACTGTPRGRGLLRPETVAMMEQNRLCPTALNDFVAARSWASERGFSINLSIDNKKYEKFVHYKQCKKVKITSKKDFYICLDGEMVFGNNFVVEICPKAVTFAIPEGAND